MKTRTIILLAVSATAFVFSPSGLPSDEKPREDRILWKQRLQSEAEPLEKLAAVIRQSAEYAEVSVVHIESSQIKTISPTRDTRRSAKLQIDESATGILTTISDKQVVLTNRHVVEGVPLSALRILAKDRSLLRPSQILTNAEFDLGVILLDLPDTSNQVSADIGDSEKVNVGDFVLAIGSPFGLEQSVSFGIVSAVGRRRVPMSEEQIPLVGFIQTDAAINPGSSGGPLVNLRGEVVGLITAIASQGGGNEGIAFAIPINVAVKIAKQLVENGVVFRAFLGAEFDAGFDDKVRTQAGLTRMIGARINKVLPDSPAQQGELATGDIVIAIDGIDIQDGRHVIERIAQQEVDSECTVTVLRNGKRIDIPIKLTAQISR